MTGRPPAGRAAPQLSSRYPALIGGAARLLRLYLKAVALVRPVRVSRTVFGATLRCDARDVVQARIRFFGIYEHNLTHLMTATLRPGDVVADLGANIGYFTLLGSLLVGDAGRVLAVEADPRTFALLSENVARNSCRNVTLVNAAASPARTRVKVVAHDRRNIGRNAVAALGPEDGPGIPGLPLRDLLGELMGTVRFIKIDVEGSEGPVLRELLASLDELSPDLAVAAEIMPDAGWAPRSFRDAGFDVYAMPNNYKLDHYLIRDHLVRHGEDRFVTLLPVEEYDARWTDYLFVRGAGKDAARDASRR